MHALVVGGAPVAASPLVVAAVAHADLVIAADSGAATAEKLGRRPHVVIGDLDSIDAHLLDRLRDEGVEIASHPDLGRKTDLHVAILAAIGRGANAITIVGAIGGERLDHALANVLLLGNDEFAGARLRLVDGSDEAHVVRDEIRLTGIAGDYVTLLPLTDRAAGVRTGGLRWELHNATLHRADSLGVSNELVGESARVAVREGVLLVAHHHRSRG